MIKRNLDIGLKRKNEAINLTKFLTFEMDSKKEG